VVHAPLGVRENNIGNGGKHKKKLVKIKARKQSYEVLVYRERLFFNPIYLQSVVVHSANGW
jgi:hypothetical protein